MEQLTRGRDALLALANGFDRSVVWSAVAGFLVLIFASNYALTSRRARPAAKDGQPSQPPEHPSVIPFIGHVPQFLACQEWFLKHLRSLYPEGIFSIRIFGSLHSFILNPEMTGSFLNKPKSASNNDFLSSALLHKNFGLSKSDTAAYMEHTEEIVKVVSGMLTESGLKNLMDPTVYHIKRNIADLVTFNSSPADQADWEVAAGAEVFENSKGESFVQVDLMELVRNFVAKTANPSLFGTNFVDNFPDAWQHIWKFDAAFVQMSYLPSWLPLPSIGMARAAARKFRAYTYEYHEAIEKYMDGEDPGIKWQDLDNISTMQKERVAIFRRANLSIPARAGADLAFAWAMNANANPLIAWMLWEISRDVVLVEEIREEIAPYVRVTQPRNEFGAAVWVAPELEHVDIDGLITKCPLLKGSYLEALRLYTGSWAMKRTFKDVVVGERGKDQTYLLKQGSYVHVPQDLHQMDPDYFPDPREFQPQRHIRETKDEKGHVVRTADMGTMKPYSTLPMCVVNFESLLTRHVGGGPNMCKGRAFALRELMLYTAVILSFYEIEAPEGLGWMMPKTEKRAATRHPLKPLTVWVKRREIAETKTEK